MSPSKLLKKQPASAKMNYFDWQEKIHSQEKPYQIFIAVLDPKVPTSNLTFHEGPEEDIHDARGEEDSFELNTHGFAWKKHSSKIKGDEFADRGKIEGIYLEECRELLRKELEGVDEVFIFDWRLRDTASVPKGATIDMNNPMERLKPARHVHIDQSPAAVVGRTRWHLPTRAEELLQGRVRIVNIWRPLNQPVLNYGLALCDGRTVSDKDKVEADHVRRQYSGSTFYVKYSSEYRWHYLYGQRPDEVTLIKCFDSDPDVEASCAPHTSFFVDSDELRDAQRESIEVRALVFTYV
ncbi:hypothetical protein B0O99DRAFT_718975 [Bisporella sp. PMI_857]|nr:hypothetical protein B0O99DRAFT_718975 [Bisporella sp. PMI_857]